MRPEPPQTYSISRDGQVLEEVTGTGLTLRFKDGHFLPTDLYWCAGMDRWRPLGELFRGTETNSAKNLTKFEIIRRSGTSQQPTPLPATIDAGPSRATTDSPPDAKRASLQLYAALISLMVSALICLVFLKIQRVDQLNPETVGRLIGSTIGLWGVGGLTVLFSKKENICRNWVIAVGVIGFFAIYGQYR